MTSTITQLLTSAVQSQSSSMPCAASSRSDTAVFLEMTASLQNRGKPFIRSTSSSQLQRRTMPS